MIDQSLEENRIAFFCCYFWRNLWELLKSLCREKVRCICLPLYDFCTCCDCIWYDCFRKFSFCICLISPIAAVGGIITVSVIYFVGVTSDGTSSNSRIVTGSFLIVLCVVGLCLIIKLHLVWSSNYWCFPNHEFRRRCRTTISSCLEVLNSTKSKGNRNYQQLCGTDSSEVWHKFERRKVYRFHKVFSDVEAAFTETFQLYKNRAGRDSAGLYHSNVEVDEIFEVVNEQLDYKYEQQRKILQQKAASSVDGYIVTLNDVDYKQQTPLLTANRSIQGHPCDDRINEVFLFHGTKGENIDSIVAKGFDRGKAKRGGLYGDIIYLAESSEKADQYTDSPTARQMEGLTMIYVKTLLGRTYIHDEDVAISMPCNVKHCFTPNCPTHTDEDQRCDSVIAGLNKRFREILIYDAGKCLPKFLIKYKRVY